MGATYRRAPIICLDKVLGRTKAAGGGEGITRLYSIFQAGAPAYTSNYEQNVCVYKLVLGIALAWLHRGGETTASCAEVSAPTLHLLPPSTTNIQPTLFLPPQEHKYSSLSTKTLLQHPVLHKILPTLPICAAGNVFCSYCHFVFALLVVIVRR